MDHTEGTFKSADGLDLFYQAWLPDKSPKAAWVIVHGFGEHSGRYFNLVNYFVPRGYALYAFDQRGHGRSSGQRGHVNRYGEYLADVQQFLKLVRAAQPGKLFLMGHSMGGLIVLMYAIHHPQDMDAVIASSPFLGINIKAPGWKVALARGLSSLLPAFSMSNTDLHNEDLSRDPEVVAAAGQDALNHRAVTPRWFTETTAAQASVMARAHEFCAPLLLAYATADKIADPNTSRAFFERVTCPDKTVHAYEGYYHEILNDIGKEAVLEDMERWLTGRV